MATHASPNATDPELERTAWDLAPLLEGEGGDGVERRLAEALTRSQAFAERYAGKLDFAKASSAVKKMLSGG